MTTGSSSNSVFHATDECERLQRPDAAVERTEQYVRSHDPRPCKWCHDDVETPSGADTEPRTPLRDRVNDDG